MAEDGGHPAFRYHPDPLATGSAIRSDAPCSLCGAVRGVVYDGPVHGRRAEVLCLVCISSGDAARALAVFGDGAEFTDVGVDVPDDVPPQVLDEVAHRTPGFRGWQQEHWLYHCGDATAYLGLAGYAEVRQHPEALEMLLHENDEFGWSPQESRQYVEQLSRAGDSTAYLFRCLTCGTHLAYTDMS